MTPERANRHKNFSRSTIDPVKRIGPVASSTSDEQDAGNGIARTVLVTDIAIPPPQAYLRRTHEGFLSLTPAPERPSGRRTRPRGRVLRARRGAPGLPKHPRGPQADLRARRADNPARVHHGRVPRH